MFCFIYRVCVCAHACGLMCAHFRVHTEVRGQLTGVYSLLLLTVSQGSNLGYLAWRQDTLNTAILPEESPKSHSHTRLFQATQRYK